MNFKTIAFTKESCIATITFNRPDTLNAFDFTMSLEMAEAIKMIKEDVEVRCLILTGTGRAFCAGGDIKGMLSEFSSSSAGEQHTGMKNIHSWLLDLINLDRPVIAAVNGYAVGAGLSLAMTADIIIAAQTAKFAQSFVGVGLVPDLAGSFLLPRLIGLNKAKELTFLGDVFDADTACALGLVNKVVPDGELETVVWQMAVRLAQGPTKAIAIAKGMLNRSLEMDLPAFLDYEASCQTVCAGTEDFKEGIQAFKEKRKPNFTGI